MVARYDLQGATGVVTGGAGALGAAIAQALAEANARVEIWDRDAAGLERVQHAIGGAVSIRVVDVIDECAVGQAARACEDERGPVAILVNNAGVLGPVANSWEVDAATFRRVIDINLTGAHLCSRAIVPLMLASGVPGRIVNMASTQAKEGTAQACAYAASKAGLIALTKVLAKELAAEGILVNAVAPTAAEGAMADSLTPERRADLLARIPLGRFVTPEEIAAQVLWLCSDACSFATGAVFDMSGGRTTW